MDFNKPISPEPYREDLTAAEQRLRMSRMIEGVDHWLGNTPWSDSEAAERSYGWPIPPSRRPSLGEALNQNETDERRQLGESAIAFVLIKEDDGNISYARLEDSVTDVD